MTITVQVAGMRQSLESAEPQQVSDFIALTTPSKILMDITPDNVVALSREGSSLLVEQVGGDSLEVMGFFGGSQQSQLYLPGEDGQLLMASMNTDPGSNSLSTMFVAASDEALRFDPDALLASAEPAAESDSPVAQDWWEEEEVVEDGGEEAAAPGSFAVDEGVQIDEVFQAEEEAPAEEAEPAEEAAMQASTAPEGSWLDGVGPDLMGFMAFGAALGARAASNQSSSSGGSRRTEEDEAQDVEDATQEAEGSEELTDDETLIAEADDDLLLQEDEDLLVLEGEEGAEEAAMAAAPESGEVADMPQMASLSDAFDSTDELVAAGPEVMA